MKLLATFDDVIDIRQFNNTDWAVLKSSVFIQETGSDTDKSDVTSEIDPDFNDDLDIDTFEVPDIEELDSEEDQPQIAEMSVADAEENQNTSNCAGADSSHPDDSIIEETLVHSSDSKKPDVEVLGNEPQRSVMEINLQCRQSLCDAAIQKGYQAELASEIASAAFSNLDQVYKRIDIYHSFLRKFGRVKGTEYYKLIKWMHFPEYTNVVPSTVSSDDLGNNDDCEQVLNSTELSESCSTIATAKSENTPNCQSEIPSDCEADPSVKGNFEANNKDQISGTSDTNTYVSLFDCPIDSMNLPIRVHHALERAGYRYARQFIYMPDEELLKIRYLGMKGVTIIRDWVSAHTRDQSDY